MGFKNVFGGAIVGRENGANGATLHGPSVRWVDAQIYILMSARVEIKAHLYAGDWKLGGGGGGIEKGQLILRAKPALRSFFFNCVCGFYMDCEFATPLSILYVTWSLYLEEKSRRVGFLCVCV